MLPPLNGQNKWESFTKKASLIPPAKRDIGKSQPDGCRKRTEHDIILKSPPPPELWGEAVAYAPYIRNRIPSGKKTKTLYEILFKNKPDVSHVRIFGSKTSVHIPDVKRKKFDPKSLEGVLVGFCERTKGYRIFIPTTKKVEVSLDVLIDEMSLNLEPMRFTKQQQKN